MDPIKSAPQKEPEHGEDDVNLQSGKTWYYDTINLEEHLSLLETVSKTINPYPGLQTASIVNTDKSDPVWPAALFNDAKSAYAVPTSITDPIAFCFDDSIDTCTRFNAMFSYETIFGGKLVELNSCDDVTVAFGESTGPIFGDYAMFEDWNACVMDDAIDYGTITDFIDRKDGLRDPLAPLE